MSCLLTFIYTGNRLINCKEYCKLTETPFSEKNPKPPNFESINQSSGRNLVTNTYYTSFIVFLVSTVAGEETIFWYFAFLTPTEWTILFPLVTLIAVPITDHVLTVHVIFLGALHYGGQYLSVCNTETKIKKVKNIQRSQKNYRNDPAVAIGRSYELKS